jgi:hypothetical protein
VVYVLVLSGKKVRTLYQTHPLSGEDDEKEEGDSRGVSDARSAMNAGRINEPVKGTETEMGEESRQSEVVRGEAMCGGEVKTADEVVRCRELGGGGSGRGCVGVPMSLARERQAYRDAMLAKGLVEGSESESYLEEFRPVCESALSSMQDGEGGVYSSSSSGNAGGGEFESYLEERLGGSDAAGGVRVDETSRFSEVEEGGQLDWSDGSDEDWQACGSCSEESKSKSNSADEDLSDSSSSGDNSSVTTSSLELEIREVSLVDHSSQWSNV